MLGVDKIVVGEGVADGVAEGVMKGGVAGDGVTYSRGEGVSLSLDFEACFCCCCCCCWRRCSSCCKSCNCCFVFVVELCSSFELSFPECPLTAVELMLLLTIELTPFTAVSFLTSSVVFLTSEEAVIVAFPANFDDAASAASVAAVAAVRAVGVAAALEVLDAETTDEAAPGRAEATEEAAPIRAEARTEAAVAEAAVAEAAVDAATDRAAAATAAAPGDDAALTDVLATADVVMGLVGFGEGLDAKGEVGLTWFLIGEWIFPAAAVAVLAAAEDAVAAVEEVATTELADPLEGDSKRAGDPRAIPFSTEDAGPIF